MSIGGQQIGSDPELFVVNDEGEAISAHLLPNSVYGENMHGFSMKFSVRRDGPAVELNPTPMYCRDYIVPTYWKALMHIQQELKKGKHKGKLSLESTVTLSKESLEGDVPEDVCEFGCQPDFSAYTLNRKAPTLEDGDRRRFGGGHIHMSINRDTNQTHEPSMDQAAAAVFMDYLAALPAVAILGATHARGEAERREFYGQAGSFRPKGYGIEYRALSTKNLFLHPVLSYIMLQSAKAVADRLSDKYAQTRDPIKMVKEKLDLDQLDEIRQTINTHDFETAQRLVSDSRWQENAKFFGLQDSNVFKVINALVRASADGCSWSDDFVHNWGLLSSLSSTYGTVNHKFWGPDFVARYQVDDIVFPQYPFLDKEYKAKMGKGVQFILRHPKNPDYDKLGIKADGGRERTIFG